jgi:hypothetical protein
VTNKDRRTTLMYGERQRCNWLGGAGAVVLVGIGSASTQPAWSHNGGGGGGAGESGTATHQHLDSRFSHNRYYYDRGYAVHIPPAGGVADLIGRNGEHYYFQGGNWYRWRGDWYRFWGGAWVVVDAPVGLSVPVLPPYYTTIWRRGTPYYYANDTYYIRHAERNEYEVVAPPQQTARSLPSLHWITLVDRA